MNTPVILSASSNSKSARETYTAIGKALTGLLANCTLYWGYGDRAIKRDLQQNGTTALRSPAEILNKLATEGHRHAVVQSLHLLPGHEFHSLHQEVRQAGVIAARIGQPLLSSPADYDSLLDLLEPLINPHPDHALLLVGHGTRHPSWPLYLGLENLMQKRFGKRALVGVVEHYPASDDVVARIKDTGLRKVLIIPFFMITGVHFSRDIIGDNDSSWLSRLQEAGLEVDVISEGIGRLPGIGGVIASHIQDAIESIPNN